MATSLPHALLTGIVVSKKRRARPFPSPCLLVLAKFCFAPVSLSAFLDTTPEKLRVDKIGERLMRNSVRRAAARRSVFASLRLSRKARQVVAHDLVSAQIMSLCSGYASMSGLREPLS
jgi:hypothetical protein